MDRGFAWIVLLRSFFTYMFIFGTMKSYGVLYTEMVEHFSSGSGNTAWIDSIAWFLLQGLGIGYGLAFTPCVTIINYYFKKRRALANGIMVSAGGIGALCFPFLYRFLIDKYGLLRALWIIGAMLSNICVAGCVFRQPEQLKKIRKLDEAKEETKTEENDHSLDNSIASGKRGNNKHLKKTNTCGGCRELDIRLSLFKNRLFAMYTIAFMLSTFGHVNNTILIPAHVKALGYDKKYVSLSVSITGGAEIIARILVGWFADLNIVRRKYIFVVCMFIGGVFSVITPLFESFTYMAIYAAASATFPASFLSLISVLAIEVVGMDIFHLRLDL